MKLLELSILSSQLVNYKTGLYQESRMDNRIFYYFVESLMNKYQDFVNTIDEDECSSLLYDSEKQMLHATDDGLPKQIRRRLSPIDDDIYKIGIEVEG